MLLELLKISDFDSGVLVLSRIYWSPLLMITDCITSWWSSSLH